MYSKQMLVDPSRFRNVKREIYLLKKLNHPKIIKLHHAINDRLWIVLVMEYVGTQSLRYY